MPRHVFVTGGTGYIGLALLDALVTRGHKVRALVRPASAALLPPGVSPVFGNALDAESFADEVPPADTFVQLVGTPHPGPRKASEFARVDLPSGLAAVNASVQASVRHLVYVSVAHPAPVMQAYIAARMAVEEHIGVACATTWLAATILRPWYVLGPGHRWPYLLAPLYALGPRSADDARGRATARSRHTNSDGRGAHRGGGASAGQLIVGAASVGGATHRAVAYDDGRSAVTSDGRSAADLGGSRRTPLVVHRERPPSGAVNRSTSRLNLRSTAANRRLPRILSRFDELKICDSTRSPSPDATCSSAASARVVSPTAR
jgi:uncharacterized protein YbjT (DUF2867 family)